MKRTALLSALALALSASPGWAQDAPVASAAVVAPEAPLPPGLLSDAVRPERYRLDLTVDPAQPRFTGRAEIDVTLKAASAFIDLHGRDLTIKRATARVGSQTFTGTWEEKDPTGVGRLRFAEVLPAGPVVLAFEYDGLIGDSAAGMFRAKVADDWYSWTQLQSIDARAVFPSFDQPSFKTPFDVIVRTPPGLVAVSNAPQTGVTREAGLDVHRFASTLPLPTYLVAVMTGPFAVLEGTVPPTPQRAKPLPLRIVTTKPNAPKMKFALDGSKEIVRILEDYFADAFPYPKLDQITSPLMPGAMENAGADLYGDDILIVDEASPVSAKRTFGMVVAHELAHQWYGDLVTPAWWDDIWLNESFANWMGYRIGGVWRPDLNIAAGALEDGFDAMVTDALIAGRPIRQPISTNAQIDGAFDSITYGKGGHVVSMIAAFMGDEKFRDGVRRYMAAHRYGNATSTDFFAALAEAAGDPQIVPAMRSFTQQAGVPLLAFRRKGQGYEVSQNRYAPLGAIPPATRWGVPMCLRRGIDQLCHLLTEDRAEVSAPGKGVLVPNAGGAGYYRFELEPAHWDALIADAGSLTSGEALALSDSLGASIRSGNASVMQLGALARVLASHPDTYAAAAPMTELGGLAGSGVMDDRGRHGWRRLVVGLNRPLLAKLGFDPRLGAHAADDPEVTLRRVQVVNRLIGSGREKPLRRRLMAATRAYLGGDSKALDPAWFETALGLYVQRGGLPAAKVLLEKALASEDPEFRPAAITAIGGSGLKPVARWALEDVRDARLRSGEQRSFLSGALLTRATRDFGYTWLTANLDRLMSGGGGIFFASRMPGWLRRFCSAEDAARIASDLRPRLKGKTGELELERTIERVGNCATLREARGKAITDDFAAFR